MRAPAASLAAILAAGLVLAGCAGLSTRTIPEAVQFELSGRIAVRYGEESTSGNVAWRHAASGDELLLTTALGQGVARIVRDGEAVTLTTAEPRVYTAGDAESLTEQVLGFRLPLAGLADWVRARASPASEAEAEYLPDGKLKALAQSGWRIEYLEYDGALPSRLRLSYPGIELRLAISEWK